MLDYEKAKRGVSVQQKRKESGANIRHNIDNIAEETDDISGTTKNEKENLIPASYETFDRYTFEEPIDVVLPVGTKAIDLASGGRPDQNIENTQAQLGGVYNTYVYDNPYGKDAQSKEWQDMMVPKEIKDRGAVKAGLKVVPMVTVRYKTKDKDGNDIVQSNQVPLSSVKNALVGDKGQNKKFFEAIESKAEERTKALNKNQATTTKEQKKKETHKTKTGISFTVE
jgi:hypothetical protein